MKTAAAVKKQKTVFFTAACKTPAGVSHSFHRPGGGNQQTTKPDRSLATKTGHFYLLPTVILRWVRGKS